MIIKNDKEANKELALLLLEIMVNVPRDEQEAAVDALMDEIEKKSILLYMRGNKDVKNSGNKR